MEILKNAKTVWIDPENFKIPDGPTIWTIKLEVNGERDMYKTMSKALATEGFVGDVEIYTNNSGKTYVRQAPKEESANTNFQSNEERTESIYRCNALNNAVQYHLPTGDNRNEVCDTADLFYEWLTKGGKK